MEERIIRTLEDEGWLFELLLYDLPVCEKQDAIQDLKFGLIEEVDSKKRVLPFESYYYHRSNSEIFAWAIINENELSGNATLFLRKEVGEGQYTTRFAALPTGDEWQLTLPH